MAEFQTILIGVLANVIGDQLLIVILTGLLHRWGRRCAAHYLGDHVAAGKAMLAAVDTSQRGLSAPLDDAANHADPEQRPY